MKISVIVVSYNKCKLLRQSLKALTTATTEIESEIILVDTSSDDHTIETVLKEFPHVRITSVSSQNPARALNHGIRMANSDYILLLKPDAIVQPDSITKAVEFMDVHTAAGGLGVRLLNTFGNYLDESKKILPRTWVTFFKFTGLLKQFPKSRLTEHIPLHHDDEFDTSETDVLSSTFMLIRSSVLNTAGVFDERFSTYGANIDLSYRIRLAGFKNYYFPKTYVIDLQSDRTIKINWAHLKSFYGAMFIFAAKYFFSLPAINVKPMQDLLPAYELKG